MEQSILIIGANGGLAIETIKELIKAGYQQITMGCRTAAKGIAAKEKIVASVPNSPDLNLEVVGGFDMNDPVKIEKAVKSLPAQQPFDIVFLAAGGAVFTEDYQTIAWNGKAVERNVFQNMMGSHVTLSQLKKHRLLVKGARVVISGGEGARGIKGMIASPSFSSPGELRKYVFAELKSEIPYKPMNALGASKLFGAIWTTKMAELEVEQMEVLWFSPGLTYGTGGLASLSPAKRWLMKNVVFNAFRLIGQAQGPEAGGKKIADCLTGKIGKNGELIGAPKGKSIGKLTDQRPMNPAFDDAGLREEFWKILEELFGPFGA